MDQSANPLINLTPNIPTSPNTVKTFIQKNLTKIIFGALGLVVIIELILGVRTLTQSSKLQTAPPAQISSMSDAKLVILPQNDSVRPGQNLAVKINVVTGGKSTDSTDLILKYDPKYLEASSSSITQGQIYSDYPVMEVDSSLGLVAVSGITPPKKTGFTGIGTLATINFKAKTEGVTKLSVDFKKGETADSNVVASGSTEDILSEVFNADINISQNATPQAKAAASCQGYSQYCQTSDGKTGRQYCQAGKKDGNACIFDPRFTVSCSVCTIE